MSRKSRKQRLRSATPIEKTCTSKISHPDEPSARIAAQKVIFVRKAERMYVYPCTFCTGWHTTSRFTGFGAPVTFEHSGMAW